MASSGSALDTADFDASLEKLIMDADPLSDKDMMPLDRPNPEVHDESDTPSSDSSLTPPKPSLPRSKAKKARKVAHQSQKSNPSLRPAKDILSRIRHDPALEECDFIVGYHDRHADVMEMDVSAWKGGGDVTDEEWIPQHRILYFRKKGEDGLRIWDRAARLDRLFGSGIVPNEHLTSDVEIEHVNEAEDPSADQYIRNDKPAQPSKRHAASEIANPPSIEGI